MTTLTTSQKGFKMKEIISKIKKSKRVAIIAHISPDPDCMSSMTALSCILEQLGKQTKMFVDCDKFRPIFEYYNLPQDINAELNKDEFDTIIAVDLPQLSLMGKYGRAFSEHNNVLVIDHHASRNLQANAKYVDDTMSSCSEIIFDLAIKMGVKITPKLASLIYAGIIGDTNCFQNDNTNEHTFYVALECLKHGAEKNKITFLFQKHQTFQEIKLKQLAYQNMVIKNKVAYAILTKAMFKEAGIDDLPCFVNEMLNTDDNIFSFLIKQKDKNTYTVSLRCKEGYNVAKVALVIGGGGHIQAAGATFVGAPIRTAKLIYDECIKQIKEQHV